MAGKYLKPERALREFQFSEENEKDYEWFKDKLPQCNRQVENDLFGAFDEFPTDENSDLFKSFADAALAFMKYQRAIYQSDKDGEETSKQEYEMLIEGLKEVGKNQPTTNTRTQQRSYSATIDSQMLNNIPGMTDSTGSFFSNF